MTKIVYNACYGGYGLSDEAKEAYFKLKGISFKKVESKSRFAVSTYLSVCNEGMEKHLYETEDRSDPDLVKVVETLGEKANGFCANLQIEEIPEGTLYRIDEYDGHESVMTVDDYTWSVA